MLFTLIAIIFSNLIMPTSGGVKFEPEQLPAEIIVFNSDRDGNDEIYLTDPQGKQMRRLTSNTCYDQHPRISPDKQQIVFQSDRDGNCEIYLMNIDGTGQSRLTDNPAEDGGPGWSPDGRKIVFCSDRDETANLYTIKPDGSDLQQLTRYKRGVHFGPTYSPDGKRIALTVKSRPGHRWRSAVLELENFELWKVCRGPGNCRPAWSPDGKQIAFVKHVSRPNTEIWLYDLSSRKFSRLTHHPAKDYDPAFSPDGKEIVFSSRRDNGHSQLYLIKLEDKSIRRLTESSGNDGGPDWR